MHLTLSGHEPESFLEVHGSVDFAYLSYLVQKYARMLLQPSKFHRSQRTEELRLEAADCYCGVSCVQITERCDVLPEILILRSEQIDLIIPHTPTTCSNNKHLLKKLGSTFLP